MVTVTLTQVLRFNLSRQGLLERHSEVRNDMFPLHATAITTPPLSLLARVSNFREDHMPHFLRTSRFPPLRYTILRCMRSTLHIVPSAVYDVVTKCYNYEGCDLAVDRMKKFGLEMKEYQMLASQISDILVSSGPLTTVDISKHVKRISSTNSKITVKMHSTSGKWSTSQSNVGISVQAMFSEAKLVYGLHHSGDDFSGDAWKSQTRLYGISALETTIDGEIRQQFVECASSPRQADNIALMSWYFELYSPASLQDFVWWSGKRVVESRAALTHLVNEGVIQEVAVKDMPQTMYIFSSHLSDLQNCPDTPLSDCVRFLPYEDAIIKAYKETRYRFFYEQEESGKYIANTAVENLFMFRGEALPTVWRNGQIIGKWKWETGNNGSKNGDGSQLRDQAAVIITTLTTQSKHSVGVFSDEIAILCSMLGVNPRNVVYHEAI